MKQFKKADKLTGMLVGNIQCKDKSTVVPLLKTLSRPILEYGNVVWNTRLKKHITHKLKLFKEGLLRALLFSKTRNMKKGLGGYAYLPQNVDALEMT